MICPAFPTAAVGGAHGGAIGQNVTPNALPIYTSPLEPADMPTTVPTSGHGGQSGGVGDVNPAAAGPRPRVVLEFPANPNDILLSGTLGGGEALAHRALAVDMPLGAGHVVMFALRPFWRWQTQGTFFLAFNAILNWDHLDAGTLAH